jgi:hypothetical protein
VQDDNKTVVPTVIFLSLAIFSFSALSGGAQHCQSEYEQWPVVETGNKVELPFKVSDLNAADCRRAFFAPTDSNRPGECNPLSDIRRWFACR